MLCNQHRLMSWSHPSLRRTKTVHTHEYHHLLFRQLQTPWLGRVMTVYAQDMVGARASVHLEMPILLQLQLSWQVSSTSLLHAPYPLQSQLSSRHHPFPDAVILLQHKMGVCLAKVHPVKLPTQHLKAAPR
jgi:hypothetical protein